jgi:hypothetical protein
MLFLPIQVMSQGFMPPLGSGAAQALWIWQDFHFSYCTVVYLLVLEPRKYSPVALLQD